ncbi:MAG: 2-(1,2-epoxy-1,2-dihydrophenyl)acetyl-CoA isomerase [Bacteroidetes bacterium]|nr:MAG: 2-(1,2-epoxy-1,2-dihydrophenyl)acetyl-CoA isomerase [Bacteroidota bacterium]
MPPVSYTINNGVAFVTLNRPDKFNSFNRPMALLLQQLLDAAGTDPTVRCVYLTGQGKAFCAGQDLAEVTDPEGPGMNRILSEHFNPIIARIVALPKPVVAAVNGVAAGAGANIALACDVVVAKQTAAFIQAFSKIGLIPDSGGTYTLPRLVGWQKASALMMLGQKVGAEEAERMGMIYKWFADDEFDAAAQGLAYQLAAMPTAALAFTKKALQHSATHSLEQQLQTEDELQQMAAATLDFKEGVAAFMEKRPPQFTGQ